MSCEKSMREPRPIAWRKRVAYVVATTLLVAAALVPARAAAQNFLWKAKIGRAHV